MRMTYSAGETKLVLPCQISLAMKLMYEFVCPPVSPSLKYLLPDISFYSKFHLN